MGVTLPGTGEAVETADAMGTGKRQAMALAGLTGNKSPVNFEDAASADGDAGIVILARRTATPADTSGTDGDYEVLQIKGGRLWANALIGDGTNAAAIKATTTAAVASDPALVVAISPNNDVVTRGYQATSSITITRPSNITQFAVNDVYADTTPTAGGFPITSLGRVSGGAGVITDIVIINSNNAAIALQGELWLFDDTVTAVADNAAWNLSDTDAAKVVAILPFALTAYANNSLAHLQGLSIGYTCVGSAHIYFLIRVTNTYTPASGETLKVRAKCIQNT